MQDRKQFTIAVGEASSANAKWYVISLAAAGQGFDET